MIRPWRILRDLRTDRDRPNLLRLERIENPERFVRAILPHAARTFSACIHLLPARAVLPAAVGYLYCRMLDTYEDLVPDAVTREASLGAFAARLDGHVDDSGRGVVAPAPAIGVAADRDARDRAHLLLVRRSALVDRVFESFDPATRGLVRDLVRAMAEGMVWASRTFAAQGEVLADEGQLALYCRHVLGNPVVFTVRLLRHVRGRPTELTAEEREHAHRVGEMVQIANVTRDVEKDLRRGIAYDAGLRGDLRRVADGGDAALVERVRAARERMLRTALCRAPSYGRMLDAMELPRWSVARSSAVLMLLFTDRSFRSCARRCGLPEWSGSNSTFGLFLRSIPATFSRSCARRTIARVEATFLAAGRSPAR
jgi:phytoene/squalene synthetase